MRPRMIALERTFDPEAVENKLSGLSKVPYSIQISLMQGMAEDGYGQVTVDGIVLSEGKVIDAAGFLLLHIPVGEVAREYEKTYEVCLSGFRAKDGRAYAPCRFKLKTTAKSVPDPAYADHDEKTLIAAREAMVLLKNENDVLPLAKESVLNLFGVGQFMYRITATGASLINPRWKPDFHRAVEEHSHFVINKEVSDLYRTLRMTTPDAELLKRAREKNDTAVIFLTRASGEMQDNRAIRGQYYLSKEEEEMIAAITSVFEKTVAILNVGYPIEMSWVEKYQVDAVLYTGFCGMLSTYALVEILDGRTNPSGKLPDTWTVDYYDNPVSKNFPLIGEGEDFYGESGKGVEIYYEEDIYLGYRYFDTFQKSVAYAFGHGLSYTTFDHHVTSTACDLSAKKDNIKLRVEVKNTGAVSGKEVLQLYMKAPEGRLEKPAHVLAGFEKTKELAPGEVETLDLTADLATFASFDEESAAYVLESGIYHIYVGTAVDSLTEAGSFELKEEILVRKTGHWGAPVEEISKLTQKDPIEKGEKSRYVDREERLVTKAVRPKYQPEGFAKYQGKRILWPQVKENPGLLQDFVSQMTEDELCMLNVCAGSQWAPWQSGCAGVTPELKKYHLPVFRVSDANAGLNIKKKNVGFPASSMITATFNKEIAYMVGQVIAEESREHKIHSNLGPGMNLHRGILNGRHPEYFSEDPYLTGVMAGYHGKGLEENGVGCCYKHMFCNNSDNSRKASHSIVSERALRELYFKSFEIAMSIHKASTIMTSYNALNGLYPAENADLLQGLIRGEWGFEGYIMSDWDTYETVDPIEMVKAGNCWITSGGRKYVRLLQKAVKEGKVVRAVLENNVYWLLKVMLKWMGEE